MKKIMIVILQLCFIGSSLYALENKKPAAKDKKATNPNTKKAETPKTKDNTRQTEAPKKSFLDDLGDTLENGTKDIK